MTRNVNNKTKTKTKTTRKRLLNLLKEVVCSRTIVSKNKVFVFYTHQMKLGHCYSHCISIIKKSLQFKFFVLSSTTRYLWLNSFTVKCVIVNGQSQLLPAIHFSCKGLGLYIDCASSHCLYFIAYTT